MGIDCPDILNVVHHGPPTNIEQYVQETGRAGRNGTPATALLLVNKPGKLLGKAMTEYCTNNTECRHKFLFRQFLFYEELNVQKCKCCDICVPNCDCVDCL